MNFVVAGLMYHAGEVVAFWLLRELMDKYSLKEIFISGFPGLMKHEALIEKLGFTYIPDTFAHFEEYDIKVGYFSTDWIMSIFLNLIPLDINYIFLNPFFSEKWTIFYRVAISLLKYYEPKVLKLHDFPSIIGIIK